MKVALVGNNDGPLILAESMLKKGLTPVCIGLQKSVDAELKSKYLQAGGNSNFFEEFDENKLLHILQEFQPDLIVNCFCNFRFNLLLDKYKIINVHLAPLPKYRGRHPLQWALINGEKIFGVSIHLMDKQFDSGEIVWQRHVPVTSSMSVKELRNSLMAKVSDDFGHFLSEFLKGDYSAIANSDLEASYARKRTREDSRLTEWNDGNTIYRKVKALSSENYPAYILIDQTHISVFDASLRSISLNSDTSGYVSDLYFDGIEVICEDGRAIGLYGFDPSEHNIQINDPII